MPIEAYETRKKWAVIGGGMLGLSTAWRLMQRGQAVTVFEASPTVGGLTSSWRIGDVTWDRFYHVTLLSDLYLRGLLRELELEENIDWVQTRTGFYSGGKSWITSSNLFCCAASHIARTSLKCAKVSISTCKRFCAMESASISGCRESEAAAPSRSKKRWCNSFPFLFNSTTDS